MHRILVALMAVLALVPAVAGGAEASYAQNGIGAITSPSPTAARMAAGFEIAQLLAARGGPEIGVTPEPDLPDIRVATAAAEALRRVSAATLPRQGTLFLEVDHPPYYATAPPLQL